MKLDHARTDAAGQPRFKVWHPDNSGRITYVTVPRESATEEQEFNAAIWRSRI